MAGSPRFGRKLALTETLRNVGKIDDDAASHDVSWAWPRGLMVLPAMRSIVRRRAKTHSSPCSGLRGACHRAAHRADPLAPSELRSYEASIRRLPLLPLRFRRFHPPRQIIGESRKRPLQRLAALADRLGVPRKPLPKRPHRGHGRG